jgi:hypothetical protein
LKSSKNQTSELDSISCIHCGLANAHASRACRHCGKALAAVKKKSGLKHLIIKSVTRILLLTLAVLFLAYISLITTSEPLLHDQEKEVKKAIELMERRGFSKQAFVLGRLVRYRSTDNWWNRHNGHQSAYAATNFPFEVVTLYPQFFDDSVDDVERAAILLHESYHLSGYGEPGAFEGAWRDRFKLGWTREHYEFTPVWVSVKESTLRWAPQLFTCGQDGKSDCTE